MSKLSAQGVKSGDRPGVMDEQASGPASPRASHTGAKHPIETYDDALALLGARVDLERMRPASVPQGAMTLDRMHALMEALAHPERETKFVHVAGSKGKGSVCEMTAAALSGCGLAVGLYTSPHLSDVCERIRVSGRVISRPEFAGAIAHVARVLPAIEKAHGEATFFEILTAAAFVFFAEQAVDVAVIEVGLGGRLDSTNVITPEVAAIAAIHLEHTAILGDTLAKIAKEKAGIYKPGVTAITIPQAPGVTQVLREEAARVSCPLRIVGEDIEFSARFESSPELGPHHKVCVYTPTSAFEHLAVPLIGEHQAMNCGLVLGVLDALRERGFEIGDLPLARGLARTPSHGRVEVVHRNPRIVIDGAHTAESIQALLRSLGSHLRFDNLVVVFGCAADKDVPAMLRRLATGADKLVFTRAQHNARAAEPKDLARKFSELSGKMTQSAGTVKDALNLAAKAAGREDLIVVTGSFYVAGEAKALLVARSQV
jgi:dihydrofolate synthase/folylpolyglutamate synthase